MHHMKKPNFSVIIPHYNSPDLLKRCLDSIPDIEDIQVIIVDDNSSPEKVNFDYFPGQERRNTKIIFNKDSHGAGHARNLALPHAEGEWLLFADADDFYTPDAWYLFDKHINSIADIIYYGITSVNSDTMQPTERYKVYNKYVQAYASNRSQENANWLRYRHDVPWGKMIRHGLVKNNHIVFGETKYCNDTLFSCRCAIAAKTIDVVSQAAYCVTDSQNSLTKQVNEQSIPIRLSVILEKNQLLLDNNINKYPSPVLYYLRIGLHASLKTQFKIFVLCIKNSRIVAREVIHRLFNF